MGEVMDGEMDSDEGWMDDGWMDKKKGLNYCFPSNHFSSHLHELHLSLRLSCWFDNT